MSGPMVTRCGSRDSTRPTATRFLRAIVVHGAWYVSEEMIGFSGMLGRSQGCFAVADSSLPEIMTAAGARPPDLRGQSLGVALLLPRAC